MPVGPSLPATSVSPTSYFRWANRRLRQTRGMWISPRTDWSSATELSVLRDNSLSSSWSVRLQGSSSIQCRSLDAKSLSQAHASRVQRHYAGAALVPIILGSIASVSTASYFQADSAIGVPPGANKAIPRGIRPAVPHTLRPLRRASANARIQAAYRRVAARSISAQPTLQEL